MKTEIHIPIEFSEFYKIQLAKFVAIGTLLEHGKVDVKAVANRYKIEQAELLFDSLLTTVQNEILPVVKGHKIYPNGFESYRNELIIILDVKVLIPTVEFNKFQLIELPKQEINNGKSKAKRIN